MVKQVLLVLVVCLSVGSAYAGECKISITRTACPGKEAESYKKCKGAQSCDEKKAVDSAESCAKETLKACVNAPDRQKITKSKVITATFSGQPVQDGKNFCEVDRPDFNKCN